MTDDKDFILKIIQYLQNTYGIIFFITTKDFDTLYNWWEKRIPLLLIKDSIAVVVNRWREKNREIYSFSNFKYEVRKNFKSFLQLNVGSTNEEQKDTSPEEEYGEINRFLHRFPPPLTDLKEDFEHIYTQIKNNETPDLSDIKNKLVKLFENDQELNIKTGIFLRNLVPELRKPEIEARYRQNYLINKFNIPDIN